MVIWTVKPASVRSMISADIVGASVNREKGTRWDSTWEAPQTLHQSSVTPIPEDRDAAVLLRQAQEKVNRRMPQLSLAGRRLAPAYQWSEAAPELRDWVTANRDALELFRDASERPDATVHPALDRDHFILE